MGKVFLWRLALALASMLARALGLVLWVPLFVLASVKQARDEVYLAWLQACSQRRLDARRRLNFQPGARDAERR